MLDPMVGTQPPDGIVAWHEWANRQLEGGLKQTLRACCNRWKFPQEICNHGDRLMNGPARALSLIQPWAWCVTVGGKNIENRTWWTEFRGPIWIAASAQVTRRYYDQARDLILGITGGALDVPALDDLEYGKIIGRAVIVDCILPGGFRAGSHHDARIARSIATGSGGSWRGYPPARHPLDPHQWHFREQFGYVLAETRAVTPVACKGLQRLWTVPPDVLAALVGAA